MPARSVVLYPDARLQRPAAEVTDFGPGLAAAAGDLADSLQALSAIGLAGPHVGLDLRVMAIRLEPAGELRLYVNPTLIWASDERASHEEGSVSMPGVRERIERPAGLRFRYQDPAGLAHEEEAAGWPAAVIQHEIDQLDGIFWIERLSRLKRERLLKRFAKRARGSLP